MATNSEHSLNSRLEYERLSRLSAPDREHTENEQRLAAALTEHATLIDGYVNGPIHLTLPDGRTVTWQ